MMDTERYCTNLAKLDREQAIRAIHEALGQLEAMGERVEVDGMTFDNRATIASLRACMVQVEHLGYAPTLGEPGRAEAEAKHGQVWNTHELQRDFEVEGFQAPCVVVRRKSDGKRGTLLFQHAPRFYFNWVPGVA